MTILFLEEQTTYDHQKKKGGKDSAKKNMAEFFF